MDKLDNLGSPPQVRGKLADSFDKALSNRITPAGAGKTFRFRSFYFSFWGSPPQVRGKRYSSLGTDFAYRITPAGAGKTPICAHDEP